MRAVKDAGDVRRQADLVLQPAVLVGVWCAAVLIPTPNPHLSRIPSFIPLSATSKVKDEGVAVFNVNEAAIPTAAPRAPFASAGIATPTQPQPSYGTGTAHTYVALLPTGLRLELGAQRAAVLLRVHTGSCTPPHHLPTLQHAHAHAPASSVSVGIPHLVVRVMHSSRHNTAAALGLGAVRVG
jgi:hypothetical protein